MVRKGSNQTYKLYTCRQNFGPDLDPNSVPLMSLKKIFVIFEEIKTGPER